MSYGSELYRKRKENGLCVRCGKPNDGEYVCCSSCREKTKSYVNETRAWLKEHRICPRCRKNRLYGDENACPECNAETYRNTMKSRQTERYNEMHREWSKKTHHEAIAKGICTRCRSRKADYGFKTCARCRTRDAEKRRLRNAPKIPMKDRAELGLCYWCMEPVIPGYKTCQSCYDRCVENSRKADRSNHIWRSMIPRDKRKEKAG